ncbi:type 1 glutamine amidotransferase domain-containing protein [Aquisphaera insulae]|uniref:type 1 glutamine amidotransferase domain-containing protein n=1 Tax=Aquisphaera insulae TaxID=2712864 RepID=UPI0013E9BBAE|nr:type 1 glutamine amidotransferase domain-containing protein [Aquisphaera insulae]
MKILMVLTSHDQLGNTGRKTGFWLEEFAAPYFTFLDAGAAVTLASPRGGQPPIDPVSDAPEGQTDWTRRFKQDPAAQAALANTTRLAEVAHEGYDTVFYPGGHGPMWDLAVEDELKRLGGLYEKGEDWASFVVTDGELVTGQNPASSRAGAQALLRLLA